MTKEEFMRYTAYVLGGATVLAGIGISARNSKAKRKKEVDVRKDDMAGSIVVPISKEKFMEGLPTPDEFSQQYSKSSPSSADGVQLAAGGDVDALKRSLLRSSGRKLDFFGKAAEGSDAPAAVDDDSEGSADEGEVANDSDADGEGSESTPKLLRNEKGQFMSPHDPAAVEKVANGDMGSWTDIFTDPVNTFESMWDSGTRKPIVATAGTIASVYIAKKIIDAVNAHREATAKKDLDSARDEYVAMMHGVKPNDQEKSAQVETKGGFLANAAPFLLGAAIVAPGTLGAIIVNRVLENRKVEKKRKKEEANSFPDEPTVLYRTFSGEKIAVAPETALCAILVKQAMIEEMDMLETRPFVKSAAGLGFKGKMLQAGKNALEWIGDKSSAANRTMTDALNLEKLKATFGPDGKPTDATWDFIASDDMDNSLFRLISSAKGGGGGGGMQELAKYIGMDAAKEIAGSPRLQDIIVGKFGDSKYADSWGKWRDQRINDWMTEKFGNGMWGDIVKWLAKVTGIGNRMFEGKFREEFGKAMGGTGDQPGGQTANQPTGQPGGQQNRKKWYNPKLMDWEYLPDDTNPNPQGNAPTPPAPPTPPARKKWYNPKTMGWEYVPESANYKPQGNVPTPPTPPAPSMAAKPPVPPSPAQPPSPAGVGTPFQPTQPMQASKPVRPAKPVQATKNASAAHAKWIDGVFRAPKKSSK